jgi:hypothetical protein
VRSVFNDEKKLCIGLFSPEGKVRIGAAHRAHGNETNQRRRERA